MIQKFRKKNSYKIYRCCSSYAIDHIVPSVSGELNGKTIIYKTASGYVNHKRFLDLDT